MAQPDPTEPTRHNPSDPDRAPSGPDSPDMLWLVRQLVTVDPTPDDVYRARRAARRHYLADKNAANLEAVRLLDGWLALRIGPKGAA